MAQRLNLVVLCTIALLAAATQVDARRFPRQSSSVRVTVVGPGSYSSSRTSTAFSSAGTGSPSKLISRLLDDERETILEEERRSKSSKSSKPVFVHHQSADSLVKSKLPTANQFPKPRFSWPSSSRPAFSRNRSFPSFGSRTSTTGSSRVVTRGNSQVSVGGSGSASASSRVSYSTFD